MYSLWLYMTLSHIHFLYMQRLPTNATYHVLHLMSYSCMCVLVHIWGNLSYLFLQLGCAAERLVRWRGIGVHGPPWTMTVRLFHRSLTVATRVAKSHDHRHAGGHSLPACGFSSRLSSVNLEMQRMELNKASRKYKLQNIVENRMRTKRRSSDNKDAILQLRF